VSVSETVTVPALVVVLSNVPALVVVWDWIVPVVVVPVSVLDSVLLVAVEVVV
jgi:hypothetical protein